MKPSESFEVASSTFQRLRPPSSAIGPAEIRSGYVWPVTSLMSWALSRVGGARVAPPSVRSASWCS